MIPPEWILGAEKRIAPYIKRTPITYDPQLDVYFKWENYQVTGSFKARGAVNKVLTLQPWEQERGLVAASAGNHGQGVALGGKIVSAPVTIFASDQAIPLKIAAMEGLGARVVLVPGGYGAAEKAGIDYAQDQQLAWISPYNDGQVIAGQGTLALETLADLPSWSQLTRSWMTWVIPIGGGSLASGIGAGLEAAQIMAADTTGPQPQDIRPVESKLVGVQSYASPFMHALYNNGSQDGVVEEPSLADGLSGAVQDGSLTIPLVRRYVDELLLVTEDEIVQAIRYAWDQYREKIEGSSAAALAAILTGKVVDRPAVVIISGGNIQPETHAALVQAGEQI